MFVFYFVFEFDCFWKQNVVFKMNVKIEITEKVHEFFIQGSDISISHVPMSPGVSVTLCPIGESFATLICISFSFIVFGAMVITPLLLILPSLLGILKQNCLKNSTDTFAEGM